MRTQVLYVTVVDSSPVCTACKVRRQPTSSAAKALDLDFIPVATEQYDLVIPVEYLEEERVSTMLRVMRGSEFKKRVLAMGGYGVEHTGEEVPPTSDPNAVSNH